MKATKLSFFLLGAVVLTGCSTQTMIPAVGRRQEVTQIRR